MIAAINSVISSMISWVGSVIDALVGSSGAWSDLLPLFAIGIVASILMFSMKMIRKVTWGS